jgi:hypothetical protein
MIVFTLKLNFKHKEHTTSHSLCWPVDSKCRDDTPAQLTGYRRQLTLKHECTKNVCTSDNTKTRKGNLQKKLFGLPNANPFSVNQAFTFDSIKWHVTSHVVEGLKSHTLIIYVINVFMNS